MIGSHRIRTGSRWTGSPSSVDSSTLSARTTAISPSSRTTTSRVWDRIAGMSEARNISPRPRPTTTLPAPCLRGRPGVADADRPGDGTVAQDGLQRLQASGSTADLQPTVGAEDRDAGGVVAAVLEALESLDDDADRALVTDVADDAAHRRS